MAAISGWFVKDAELFGRAHRRFFRMVGPKIDYFVTDGANGLGASQKGSFFLTDATTVRGTARRLEIHTVFRKYVLRGDTEELCARWRMAIEEAVRDLGRCGPYAPVVGGKRGWLHKRAELFGRSRLRFFVCDDETLKYYHSDRIEVASLKGHVHIDTDAVVERQGRTITIMTSERTWVLQASADADAEAWTQAIVDMRGRLGATRLRTITAVGPATLSHAPQEIVSSPPVALPLPVAAPEEGEEEEEEDATTAYGAVPSSPAIPVPATRTAGPRTESHAASVGSFRGDDPINPHWALDRNR